MLDFHYHFNMENPPRSLFPYTKNLRSSMIFYDLTPYSLVKLPNSFNNTGL